MGREQGHGHDGADPKTRVVILGGGFAGVAAAMAMERELARNTNLAVTLVSRDNYFVFTPMLHEVAASDLDLTHIVIEEVDTDNWGYAGITTTEYRKSQA